ncbi:MAG: hypothetical protein ACOYK9_05710, partial [Chlamydiia bacterium]
MSSTGNPSNYPAPNTSAPQTLTGAPVDDSFVQKAQEKVAKISASFFLVDHINFAKSTLYGGVTIQVESDSKKVADLKVGYNALCSMIGLSLKLEGKVHNLGLQTGRLTYEDPEGNQHTIDLTQRLLEIPEEERAKIQEFATELLHFQDPDMKNE